MQKINKQFPGQLGYSSQHSWRLFTRLPSDQHFRRREGGGRSLSGRVAQTSGYHLIYGVCRVGGQVRLGVCD